MIISFVNFYQYFIQGYSKIAVLFAFLLKIPRLSNLALKVLKTNNNTVFSDSNSKTNKIIVKLSKNNKSKKLTYMPNIKTIKKTYFFNS